MHFHVFHCFSTDLTTYLESEAIKSAADIQKIGRQLFEALDTLHQTAKVTHRDVKPSNILVDADGTIALADFGFSSATATLTGTAGAIPYRAPDAVPTDKLDIWSSGMTMLQVAAGRSDYGYFMEKANWNRNVQPWLKDPKWVRGLVETDATLLTASQRDKLASAMEKIFGQSTETTRPSAADILKEPFFAEPL